MKSSRLLFIGAAIAMTAWLVSIGLYLELVSHDPYAWAFPGTESDISRDLFLSREYLYIEMGLGSFSVMLLLIALGLFFRRRISN